MLDVTGDAPATLLPNWKAVSCLDLTGQGFILILRSEDGVSAGWVLRPDLIFVCDLAWLNDTVDASLHRAVRMVATASARYLKTNLLGDELGSTETIYSVGGDILTTFSKFADPDAQIFAISKFDEEILLAHRNGLLHTTSDLIGSVLQIDPHWMVNARAAGRIQIPALSGITKNADIVHLISCVKDKPTYFVREMQGDFCYILVQSLDGSTSLYFPYDNLLITDHEVSAHSGRSIIQALDFSIFQIAAALRKIGVGTLPIKARGLGLMTFGIPNFGHAIWDEYQAFEVFLNGVHLPAVSPWLLASTDFTGMDLYGPVEELYPEIAGRVIRELGFWAVFARAIENGVEVVLRSGQRARKETRERILSVVDQEAAGRKWREELEASSTRSGQKIPLITFGIRLSNRRPYDFLGLYVRLAKYLRENIGPFVLVLDGMNGGSDPKRAATEVFNGKKSAGIEFADSLRDGSTALNEETEWVASFRSALGDIDLNVVSCVGMPIRQNLFWMKQSSFFIAPNGGGLAKLRWALDVPGYVLTSRLNLEFLSLLHAYDSEEQMDAPYSSLYFNGPEDVEDLPLSPPRSEPPILMGIPYPEDFIVHEETVFVDILTACRRHLP